MAPWLFAGLVALASWLRPGYSQVSDEVSYLGYGANAVVQNVNFVLTGALFIGLAVGLRAMFPPSGARSARRAELLMLVAGLGVVLAGVSLMLVDALPAGVGFVLHTTASFIAFGALIGTPLATARALKGSEGAASNRYRRFSRLSGWVGAVLLATFVATMFGPLEGLTERLFIAVPFAWIELTGWRLRSLALEAERVPVPGSRVMVPSLPVSRTANSTREQGGP